METVPFLHTADLHLDEPVKGWKGSQEDLWRRHEEHRNTFRKIVDLVQERNLPFLLIAGDFLEHGYASHQTVEFVMDQFARIPQTKVLISPGNHDPYKDGSWYKKPIWPEHVHIFSSKWEKHRFSEWNLEIHGKGFSDFAERDGSLPEFEDSPYHKLMLVHGEFQKKSMKSDYFPIQEKELAALNYDYVALGHIHKTSQYDLANERNTIVRYPGSPEALNWKELGERTVTIGEISSKGIQTEIIPIHTRRYLLQEINVDDCTTREKLLERILQNSHLECKNSYITIRLVGRRYPDLPVGEERGWLLEQIRSAGYRDLYLEDETIPDFDLERLKRKDRLICAFIEKMESRMDQVQQPKQQELIQKALYKGLEALIQKGIKE
ncbi:metallophosphoesterase family protein [Risungbinella massiliensis]|uniref:metallophosphoesterase family protein n=1 Tax=Risungbinella massiliensis TaxID=1329796 RepID=UPI0005CB94B1|nr:DNA repair exonuclease [Risungbinella massiliensis]